MLQAGSLNFSIICSIECSSQCQNSHTEMLSEKWDKPLSSTIPRGIFPESLLNEKFCRILYHGTCNRKLSLLVTLIFPPIIRHFVVRFGFDFCFCFASLAGLAFLNGLFLRLRSNAFCQKVLYHVVCSMAPFWILTNSFRGSLALSFGALQNNSPKIQDYRQFLTFTALWNLY